MARGRERRAGTALAAALLLVLAGCSARRGAEADLPATGAERRAFAAPSTSAEVRDTVARLARLTPSARVETLGRSAGGKPILALLLPRDAAAGRTAFTEAASPDRPLTVLIVASQHGTEPSGTEAVLALARDVVGSRAGFLDGVQLVLVPDGNPDGRDARRRVNANGVNLSTNYVSLSEPESQAMVRVLVRWQPDVVLDVHESALLKRRSLGAQGYLTDFEAQIEVANEPNVEPRLRDLTLGTLLPAALARVGARGLRAQRYVGEIIDVRQPITHGGPSVRNLRNAAGIRGAASFLIENRLDPPAPGHPTPRNLAARIDKQLLTMRALLEVCVEHADEIRAAARRARDAWRTGEPEWVALSSEWVPDAESPRIVVPLRRRDDGRLEDVEFARHTRLRASPVVPVPAAYVVHREQDGVAAVLERQGIAFERAPSGGELWITLRQPTRRLIPLLLDRRSRASLLRDPLWRASSAAGSADAAGDESVVEPVDDPGRLSPAPSRGRTAPRG
ncbi:MAG: M14 family zinc carboxypeptidase [Thermodesulfobacteriota bacterium]